MIPGYRYQIFSVFAVMAAVLLAPVRGLGQVAYPLPYTISTVAGGPVSGVCSAKVDAYGDGCPALQATFGITQIGLAADAAGNLYVADAVNKLVRKVDAKTGLVTVAAFGGVLCANATDKYGDGCVASTGTVAPGSVSEVSVAKNGDVYMTGGFSLILKVSASTGIMSRVAGVTTPVGKTGVYVSGFTGDGGPATSAELNVPRGVTVNAAGDVYISDYSNNAVRVVYEGGAQTAALITATNPSVTAPVVGYIYTIAGSSTGASGTTDGVPATSGLLLDPADTQIDSYGNVYILDSGNKTVRVVYSGGNIMGLTSPVVGYIYKVAGGGATKGSTLTTTQGTSVGFSVPRRMAMDAYGNLYVTDSAAEVIWFLDATTGYMRPIAGTYTATAGSTAAAPGCAAQTDVQGDGCPALKATIHVGTGTAYGLAVDANNNLYIAEPYDLSIRKVSTGLAFPATASSSPVTQTVQLHFAAGSAPATTTPFTFGNGDYTASAPACVTNSDTTQDCTVAITLTPTVPGVDDSVLTSTNSLAGVSKLGVTGVGTVAALALDPGTAASFGSGMNAPQSVAYDGNGNLLIADTANNRVLRVIAATQAQTVIAGTGTAGYSGDGAAAASAKLNEPKAVAAAADGTIYIADTGNNVVRRIDPVTGNISMYAGGAATVCAAASDAMGDGCTGTQAIFTAPAGVAVDAFGSLYVADSGNNVVRVVPLNQGTVTIAAGGGSAVCGTASDAYGDTCAATQAVLLGPTQLHFDVAGNLYIADTKDNLVRRVNLMSKGQSIVAIAGNGQTGGAGDGGAATSAQLSAPAGIALDGAGNVYIADTGNHAVRLVNVATANITTIAGINGSTGAGTLPGAATAVQLKSPAGVEVTGTGSLYVLDTGNSRALAINRNTLVFDFGKVNISSTSASQPVTVTSTGSASASASLGTPLVTSAGSPGEFTFTAATTNGCSAAQALAAGAQCAMTAQYVPTLVGNHAATYTFAGSTGVNLPAPSVALSGSGVLLVNTSSVAVQTTPATGNPQYGQTTVVTVTVTTQSQGTSTIGGAVTIQIDGTAQQPVNVVANGAGNGVAAITLPKLSVGPHTIAATYGGDAVYGGSNAAPLTVTVSKSTASATIGAAPTATIQFQSVTFTANVSAVTGGIPTGTVSFMNGATVLGMGTLNAQGVATYTTTALAVASYSVVGVYSGDANFTTANSTALPFVVSADPQDFTVTAAGLTTLNVAAGGTVQTTVTVTPTNTLTGNVTFSCSGLPANSVCTFLPSVIAFTPATDQPVTVTVSLWTGIGPGTVPSLSSTLPDGSLLWIVLIAPLGALAFSRKRVAARVRVLGATCLLIVAAGTLSGCGSNLPPAKAVTPAGTSTVTVQAAGPSGQSHALPLVFNVISQ